MKKKIVLATLFGATLLMASDVVNIYTSRHYDSDKIVYEMFTKETGIKVNVVQDKVDPLIKKLELEGKDTTADVFMTVGFGDLYKAKQEGLLQPISSKIVDENIPSNLMDKDKNWVGITYRARIVVYDPAKTKVEELSTYEDLATPKWKGKILTRSSTSSYNKHLIAFMIAKDGEEKASSWAKGLTENFARSPKGNDRDQAKAILAGDGEIAIMNSYYMGRMSASKDPIEQEVAKKLKIFFPNQNDGGTHINLSGAGITKYAKNIENAKKFIEFLTNVEAQEIFSKYNYEYPANPNAKTADVVKSWGEFKASTLDFDLISQSVQKAQSVADKAGWQ
ncbi:iron(III) ABC transporter, periplasmic iron-binding protein [Campylobacter blaseri]|uniref:Fe(3+) ABC transporter substrate-binding protein n=1 Tax=Campylobacter blaseri TaxID=2042961 RepID=A0A2P8QYK5_9BACT|nr:Fe(3+) ABC transporter substrate-binding protein [Campylobacter blaseri]PSM51333.1 Fe(3+) ABC transporter substrate-binding protein [Campylobacter blaseri]PSM52477.1 Fe(3+) ABC transporter substrate-binding protein [Campylobacter blaseri]QKF86193.1 iron(III) ABC transporter, periplasmic iron-binding protein [Campylobacter blaseri]